MLLCACLSSGLNCQHFFVFFNYEDGGSLLLEDNYKNDQLFVFLVITSLVNKKLKEPGICLIVIYKVMVYVNFGKMQFPLIVSGLLLESFPQ